MTVGESASYANMSWHDAEQDRRLRIQAAALGVGSPTILTGFLESS